MSEKEVFKTTLMGGYDKDDVDKQIQKMKDEAQVDKNRLLQLLKQKDKQIAELSEKLESKDEQIRQKDKDIKEKYQSYIDNYDQIGRLVYESRIRADRMISEARNESARIIQEAKNLAKRRLEQVDDQINDKLDEGRIKHKAIQKELDELLELLKEVRKRCMLSYENVEKLVGTYTEQEDPFADIMSELESRIATENAAVIGQEILVETSLEDYEDEHFDEADSEEELELMGNMPQVVRPDDDEEEDFPSVYIIPAEEALKSREDAASEYVQESGEELPAETETEKSEAVTEEVMEAVTEEIAEEFSEETSTEE